MSIKNETETQVEALGKNAIERERLKNDQIAELQLKLDSLQKAHMKSLEALDAINRRDMIPTIRANYNMPDNEINQLATDTMSDMVETVKMLKPSRTLVAGVRPGVDEPAADARFTVPSKFKYGRKED